MKAKKIKIKVLDSREYIVKNNEIVETNGENFTVKKEGDTLNICSESGFSRTDNVMSFGRGRKNNIINMNGLSISSKGKTLIVDGNIDIVIVNGKEFTSSDKIDIAPKEIGENEYESYSLKHLSISSISVTGNGSFEIDSDNCDTIVEKPLSLSLAGSGDIVIRNFRALPILASVAGSGDILINNVHGPLITAVVAGSGDITGRGSSFDSVTKNVVGSGNISGI